jgi:hypothetical protein
MQSSDALHTWFEALQVAEIKEEKGLVHKKRCPLLRLLIRKIEIPLLRVECFYV